MTLQTLNRIIFVLLITLLATCVLSAQNRTRDMEWWFGGAVGVNFNYYGGSVQALNATTLSVGPFTRGAGAGLFLAPMVEYHPDPVWGGMLALGYDGRRGNFDEINSGGTAASLSTSLAYLSLEPSLRVAPFASPVYFFAGPRIGFNISKSFTYSQAGQTDVAGDWSETRGVALGGQVGLGYDWSLTDVSASTQLRLSPFLAVHFGQGPRSVESWSLTTVRLGIALKVGSSGFGSSTSSDGEVQFSVKAPKVIPIERRVKETFPMRNFVFFDDGSNSIPSRYVTLSKDQASSFKEEQLLQPEPKDLTGRSRRQMTAYHNVLNVLGDRMRRKANASVTLVGSSDQGASSGKAMAEAVKSYLVNIFGIEDSRIKTEGRDKPAIPSYQAGGTREVELVRPEDRRVEITSSSLDLLEPLQIISLQEDPLDSDVQLNAVGGDNLASWTIEVSDDAGSVKRFGPFTGEHERVSGRAILADKLQGQYTIALVGETKNGQSVRREQTVRLVRTDAPDEDLGLRFSILFEFDQSKTVATYERFLSGTVAPLIPDGASVTIHGHTDIVGEESHNLNLSRDRANETQRFLERALSGAGKRRVKFDTYGFGEDVRRAPFENRLPEERFYNRTVIIDIVPE